MAASVDEPRDNRSFDEVSRLLENAAVPRISLHEPRSDELKQSWKETTARPNESGLTWFQGVNAADEAQRNARVELE